MMLYTLRIPTNYLQSMTTSDMRNVRKVTPPINSAHWLARQRPKEKKLMQAWAIEYEGLEEKIEVLQNEIKREEKTRQKKLARLMIMEKKSSFRHEQSNMKDWEERLKSFGTRPHAEESVRKAREIWGIKFPLKVKAFLWNVCLEKILTNPAE
ncbi:hypothetical protein QJS04_geneDACA012897 [Acorus gramineus]|uniref:Uncharacterized protein n=1 Tax=Acorus gramineus TaxID=55184 RepID=A0AAV9BFI4_ACOGR|nr:hypothetical protein QJS04_geneDACA012897 [Acorus gramineus]